MGLIVSWISSTFSGAGPGIASYSATSRNPDDSLSHSAIDSAHPSAAGAVSTVATKPVSQASPFSRSAFEDHQQTPSAYVEAKAPMQLPTISLSPPSIQDCENETYEQMVVTTPIELFLEEDEGLSALEKVYLFSRSDSSFHRIFIARSLPSFLSDVSPAEAVVYVLPLMDGLAMDEDDLVKEALVESLPDSIWWFITSCRVTEVETSEEMTDANALLANSFTPLLGTLLLSPNSSISSSTRQCIVNLVQRIRVLDRENGNDGTFGYEERRIFEREILDQVVIGMAHLEPSTDTMDEDIGSEQQTGSSQASSATDSSRSSQEQLLCTMSATEDTSLLTVLAPSAIAATQLARLDDAPQDDPEYPLTASIDRPPSPVPLPRSESTSSSADNVEELSIFLPPSLPPSIPSSELNGTPMDDAESDNSEEQNAVGRLASMSLMAAVTASTSLDRETQEAFVKEVERASKDPVHWVRREATYTLGALAKVVPDELVVSLLQMLDAFCGDPVWQVRQSVLFALPAVLSRLPSAVKRAHALRVIGKLALDPAIGVRTGVLEVLGELIYAFHNDDAGPPGELLALFLGEDAPSNAVGSYLHSSGPPWDSLPKLSTNDSQFGPSALSPLNTSSKDAARALICAFNLPAVVLTLGASRWGELRGLYHQFVNMESPKILQTLAASVGEIAKIIGPNDAHVDLVDAWLRFAKFKDSTVRLKSLEALEIFLEALCTQDRTYIATSLEDIWTNHLRSWNKRELLARILGTIGLSFVQAPHSLRRLLRLALRDGYATVRSGGVESYVALRNRTDLPSELHILITSEVNSLAFEESYRRRQSYVECQYALLSSPAAIEDVIDVDFLKAIGILAGDKVANIRIGVARLVLLAVDKCRRESKPVASEVVSIAQTLLTDTSNEVRSFVSAILASSSPALNASVSSIYSRPPPPV